MAESENINEYNSWLQKYAPVISLIGAVLMAVLWYVAVVIDGHWMFGEETLSRLADTGRAGGIFFNIAAIESGILVLFLAYSLRNVLTKNKITKAASILMTAGLIFLTGVGLFPITTGLAHYICAIFCFVLLGFAVLLYTCSIIAKKRCDNITKTEKHIMYISAAFTGVYILLCLMLALGIVIFPLAEALMVIDLLVWCCIVSVILYLHNSKVVYV